MPTAPDEAPKLPDFVGTHSELCRTVLRTMLLASRNIGGREFSNETWKVFVKVVLGMTDCILGSSPDKRSSSVAFGMADQLCEDLITVCMEVWLRSHTVDVEMWDYLQVSVDN
jgi:hypothetical protein